jgi:ribosome-associated translation inhibitor RaiA
MVGSYVKNISEKAKKFEKINISLESKDDSNFQLKVTLVDEGKEIQAEDNSNNLFFCLDKVLKKVESNI